MRSECLSDTVNLDTSVVHGAVVVEGEDTRLSGLTSAGPHCAVAARPSAPVTECEWEESEEAADPEHGKLVPAADPERVVLVPS